MRAGNCRPTKQQGYLDGENPARNTAIPSSQLSERNVGSNIPLGAIPCRQWSKPEIADFDTYLGTSSA